MDRTDIKVKFEDIPNPALFFDPDTLKIVAANEAAISLYGYSINEMLSLTIKDLRQKEDVPKLLKYLKQSFESNNKPGIWEHITKNKKSIFVDIDCNCIQVDGKELVLTTLKEVANLKTKHNQAKNPLGDLERLDEDLPGIIFISDSKGNLSYWNDYLETITGYSHDEISKIGVAKFLSYSDKNKFIEAIPTILNEGKSDFQLSILSKSGQKEPYFFSFKNLRDEGKNNLIGIGINVSNLIEAQKNAIRHQKLMRTIIDQTGSLIYIKDEEGTFRFVNKEFLKLFNLEHDKVIGKKDTDLLKKDEANQIYLDDKRLRSKGDPIQVEEQIEVNGEHKTFLTTKILLTGVEKYENCVFGISNDITERIKIEDRLRESLEEKKILLKEIHHRVKNNLAVVSGMMDLQSMESDNDEFINQIRDTQSRIKSIALTHELLYKAESFSNVQLGDSIKKQARTLRKTFGSNVDFRFNIKPVTLNINQALPCSLIVNEILTNALKHAFVNIKNPSISIALDGNESLIELSIQDNGIGLPNDFEVDKSNSLGMKLIRILKKQLKADLYIETSNGTLFELKFIKSDISGSGSSILETTI